MHTRNQRPFFVPAQYCTEIEKMSKAALMDLAWDFAVTATLIEYACLADENGTDGQIMDTLRARRDIILSYRRGDFPEEEKKIVLENSIEPKSIK